MISIVHTLGLLEEENSFGRSLDGLEKSEAELTSPDNTNGGFAEKKARPAKGSKSEAESMSKRRSDGRYGESLDGVTDDENELMKPGGSSTKGGFAETKGRPSKGSKSEAESMSNRRYDGRYGESLEGLPANNRID